MPNAKRGKKIKRRRRSDGWPVVTAEERDNATPATRHVEAVTGSAIAPDAGKTRRERGYEPFYLPFGDEMRLKRVIGTDENALGAVYERRQQNAEPTRAAEKCSPDESDTHGESTTNAKESGPSGAPRTGVVVGRETWRPARRYRVLKNQFYCPGIV